MLLHDSCEDDKISLAQRERGESTKSHGKVVATARKHCKENRPVCDFCQHRGLNCEWPRFQMTSFIEANRHVETTLETATVPRKLQDTGPAFSSVDFRLFYHFIQVAYPNHPLGNDSVWTHEIPSIASDYDYLLYSMLALSASNLVANGTPTESPDMLCTAIAHRLKAISSLNQAISTGINSFEQGNAMLATCFILLFQSTMIADGLVEYMTFIRGTIAVGTSMGMKRMKFLFHGLWVNRSAESLEVDLSQTPLIDGDLARSACRSIENLAGLCGSKGEAHMYGSLLMTARALITTYIGLRGIYNLFTFAMSHEDFRDLTKPTNDVGNLLLTHFVALQLIMLPITKAERIQRSTRYVYREKYNDGMTVMWLRPLHANAARHLESYYEWTRFIEKEVIEVRDRSQ
ncbi:C6 zinc finger protein [Rutstroemia sp. NJR-2017a BBW]|nr:C6 zinc finger protein [Rutstroemia sp. NJR-2017a BBW]